MQAEGIYQTFLEFLFSILMLFRTFFQALGFLGLPCEQPILYTLGTVDSGFGISSTELLSALLKAEAIWEQDSGKNLFEYNAEKGLPISLIYDERQQKTQAEQDLQDRLQNIDVEQSEKQTNAQLAQFQRAKSTYERDLADYEQQVKTYNQKVDRINKNGGATESQRKDLEDEQEELQDSFQNLEAARQQVNNLASSANQYIENNKSLIEAYNQEITTFQDQYGGEGQAFDQGVYTGDTITIYQYDDEQRLILVLAHEFGHALGIDHVEQSEALMHYLMRDQDIQSLKLEKSDRESLNAACQRPTFPWNK